MTVLGTLRDNNASNPYSIVREEQWSEDINGIHIVHSKSYDAKGRVVGVSTCHYRDGKQTCHFAEYVEADGFWRGGAYDEEIGMSCQTCHPFIEGEVIS